jgi:hypothetical protein
MIVRMSAVPLLALLVSLALAWCASPAQAELPPLIARDVLFGNPEKMSPTLSPDGKQLAWIAPDKKNVLQVWVKTIGKNDDRAVTADEKRGIRQYSWAQNSKILLYLQDKDGDENWHVHGVDLASSKDRDFTPQKGVQARLTATEPDFPDEALISLNANDPRLHDVYRLNVNTGDLVLDTKNPGDVAGFTADNKLRVRAAQIVTPEGGTELRIRPDDKSEWKTWMKVGPHENLDFLDFSADGRSAILSSSLGSDTSRVVERNLTTGEEKLIAGGRCRAGHDPPEDAHGSGSGLRAGTTDLDGN